MLTNYLMVCWDQSVLYLMIVTLPGEDVLVEAREATERGTA